MTMRFSVLASGSGGNASLLEVGDFGLLLDIGLGPRVLAGRLAAVGASWKRVQAVLLTHTHSDHWNENTLAQLRRYRIPLYCHAGHIAALRTYSGEFSRLQAEQLVNCYDTDCAWSLGPGLQVRALPVRHDSGATFGFRLEGPGNLFGHADALGYVSDLGCWQPELAAALADVDVLALEFNHDVILERHSGRSARLIARVLGDDGHLSNEQAAALLHEIVRRSTPGRLRHVVQLHLSQDCNRPGLAQQAARAVLAAIADGPQVHTASQHEPGPTLQIGASPNGRRNGATRRASRPAPVPTWLPGLEPT